MSTSGTITYGLSAAELVDQALRKLGVIGENASAAASQYAGGQTNLNLMLKTWQMHGPNLWSHTESSVTLLTGVQQYTFSPRPREIANVRFAIDGVEKRPLSKWGREDWDAFPGKASQGTPSIYVLDRQRTATTIKVWPVPVFAGQAWTLPYSYERVLEDVTGGTQEIDVPQEHLETVIMCLAARLAENYPPGDSKDQARQRNIISRAQGLYEQAMGFDRDGDVRFVPAGG